jgi:hypothetical protein
VHTSYYSQHECGAAAWGTWSAKQNWSTEVLVPDQVPGADVQPTGNPDHK